MAAWQIWLDSDLEEAVLAEVLTLEQAWLMQDEMLIQQSECLRLPMEWEPWLAKLELFQMPLPAGQTIQ